MSRPLFLDIEASSYDDDAFPVSLAWSLPDGRIKTVLVMPDESWNLDEVERLPFDIQHYYDQGFSTSDIAHEINIDLDGSTVYVDGIDPDELWLEKIFEACGIEPTFELARMDDLFIGHEYASQLEIKNAIAQQHGLDTTLPEHSVLSLLYLSQQLLQLEDEFSEDEIDETATDYEDSPNEW